jgi:hypothetical protein
MISSHAATHSSARLRSSLIGPVALLGAALAGALLTTTILARMKEVSGAGEAIEDVPHAHLRAALRAQAYAHPCAKELHLIAARHPDVTVRALGIEPASIARSLGQTDGLIALANEAVDRSAATLDSVIRELGLQAAGSPSPMGSVVTTAGDMSGRAQWIAEHLCFAREAASAATLAPPTSLPHGE